MYKISVIIVHWNVPESLKKCVDSVFATRYKNLQVIVVDNDSNPPIPGRPGVDTIWNAENIGFPKAVNLGINYSNGDYILVLNPDTQIPKDFFTKALEFAKTHSDMGVMGPKFVNPDGTPQGSVFPEPSLPNALKQNFKYTPDSLHPIEVNCVSGGCMFIPRSTIDKIGLFTEQVFMYYEDLDYCRRVRIAGLKIYFNPQITIIHEHGQSSKQSPQAQKYLRESSIWYNGWPKYALLTLVIWLSQKLKKIFT